MASPIAHFFRDFRIRSGLTQTQLAHLLGFEQGYLSAIEVGIKSPNEDLVVRLVHKLALNDVDQAELTGALNMSRRRLTVPADAPKDVFLLVNELADKLDGLHPAQVAGIRAWLRVEDDMRHRSGFHPSRLQRKDKREAHM